MPSRARRAGASEWLSGRCAHRNRRASVSGMVDPGAGRRGRWTGEAVHAESGLAWRRRTGRGRSSAATPFGRQTSMTPVKRGRSRPISRVLSWAVIPLGDASPRHSSSLPGRDAGHIVASLFGLAPGGVCRAVRRWPRTRWALTPPFHPYRCLSAKAPETGWRFAFCCTFRRLAPPRRYLAPCPVEPGLSSARLRATRLPGRLRLGSIRTQSSDRRNRGHRRWLPDHVPDVR